MVELAECISDKYVIKSITSTSISYHSTSSKETV
jgi:hypothetical protein